MEWPLFRAGYGTDPDLIYARGVPDTLSPDPITFDNKQCSLIIVKVGFCQDVGSHKRLQKKTAKYAPLVNALKAVWGKAEFVAVPIGHAGSTLKETQRHLIQYLSTPRPEIERSKARREVHNQHEVKIVFTFKVNFDLEFKMVLTSYLAHHNPLHNIIITQETSIA